ncbi:hypothetical protein JI666_13925 [Bacillus sp. NTK071]|uniref:putative phage abortive infection protein n=1 Tax=Bacillus sp. NTK071 TaxID=2802175 RepID=UPI001A8F4231|nr:putative phage abortive infection protein [Bacillus sp. NTK071]MBN8209850.1 hypothetical protein [Bacillus sp. NTK071]
MRDINYINKKTSIIIIYSFIGITFYLVALFILLSFFINEFTDKFGNYGDYINGFAMPIIALFGVLMAYKAFVSQSEQLELQKKEALKQRIENIFFQLLNCYTNIVSNMQCEDNNIVINGKEYFKRLYNKLICMYSEEDDLSDDKTKLLMAWRRLNEVEKGQLSHYYRNLYQIFKWVYQQRENIPMEEQEELIDLIKAQLSTYEISLLYFNIEYFGANDFKDILCHYNFFPNGGETILQQFKNHVSLFEKKR